MKIHNRFPVLALGAALLVPSAFAQVTAAISGRIEDSSGAAMSGVAVTLKNLETGAARSVTTNDSGNFRADSLPIGPYQIRAEKTGFKAQIRTGVNLAVGENAVVNLRLELGDLAQEVRVDEEIPVVNTTTSSVSGLVGEREIKDLPLNGRSFDNLMTLNPGVINYALKSANTSTSNGNTFSVDGHRPADNIVLLNGIEYTGSSQLAITPGGVSGYLLGIDAVREFSVLTEDYGAEYGKRSGAQVAVVTQSGSNTLHGTLFEFLRNSALDARSFFAQTSFTPPFRQNQFGGALGGPIKKNRLFLFGNYEGFRQAETLSSVSVVPDAQVRQGLFPNSSGSYVPVANLNSAMLPYFSFWPLANGPELFTPCTPTPPQGPSSCPSGTAFAYTNPSQSIREDFGNTRLDYTLRDRDWLAAAYTIDDGNSLIPLADPLFASYSALRMQVASLQETHIFSPSILNTFRAGFSRAGFNLDSSLLGQFPADLDFVQNSGPGGIVVNGGVTTTGLSGITSAGPNNAAGAWNRRNLYTFTDGVQISKGKHEIAFGVWLQRIQDNEDSASRQLGQATFASLTTFLQGTPSSFQVIPTANELGWRSLFGAWYVQDSIKLRRNLMLRAGLRHEFTTGWNEAFGRAANYITDANDVLETAPRVANDVFTKNNATKLFSARIGIAWDPLSDGKMSVRAGFGTYYSLIDDLSFLLNSLPPYNGSVTCPGSLFSNIPVIPGGPPPCTIYAPQGIQANAKTPTVQEWNLSVERQLTPSTALRVSYVGSFGYHGFLSIDPNTVQAQVCASSAGCQAGGVATNGVAATTANQTHVTQGAQYIPATTRPNPSLGPGFFWYTEGNSSYNALQTDLFHRLSRGLEIRANYTWSKSLDMNSGLTGAQSQNQSQMVLDRDNVRRDWGPSALNAASQASISGRYELPFGRAQHASGLGQKLASGWQVNAITTLLSGFPFTPVIGTNRSGDGDTRNPDRPSLNPAFSGPIVLGQPGQWFNPNAFILPPAGTYGNLGRGVFTGPGLADLDFSLLKTTPLTERASLQFRAEFFNFLNHPNFGAPNATVFSSGAINASAGLITTLATTPRQIQFGLKLMF